MSLRISLTRRSTLVNKNSPFNLLKNLSLQIILNRFSPHNKIQKKATLGASLCPLCGRRCGCGVANARCGNCLCPRCLWGGIGERWCPICLWPTSGVRGIGRAFTALFWSTKTIGEGGGGISIPSDSNRCCWPMKASIFRFTLSKCLFVSESIPAFESRAERCIMFFLWSWPNILAAVTRANDTWKSTDVSGLNRRKTYDRCLFI